MSRCSASSSSPSARRRRWFAARSMPHPDGSGGGSGGRGRAEAHAEAGPARPALPAPAAEPGAAEDAAARGTGRAIADKGRRAVASRVRVSCAAALRWSRPGFRRPEEGAAWHCVARHARSPRAHRRPRNRRSPHRSRRAPLDPGWLPRSATRRRCAGCCWPPRSSVRWSRPVRCGRPPAFAVLSTIAEPVNWVSPIDDVAAYKGPTGTVQARIAGLSKAIDELRSRRGTDPKVTRFVESSTARLGGTVGGHHRDRLDAGVHPAGCAAGRLGGSGSPRRRADDLPGGTTHVLTSAFTRYRR